MGHFNDQITHPEPVDHGGDDTPMPLEFGIGVGDERLDETKRTLLVGHFNAVESVLFHELVTPLS
jgi:hypothetical protein